MTPVVVVLSGDSALAAWAGVILPAEKAVAVAPSTSVICGVEPKLATKVSFAGVDPSAVASVAFFTEVQPVADLSAVKCHGIIWPLAAICSSMSGRPLTARYLAGRVDGLKFTMKLPLADDFTAGSARVGTSAPTGSDAMTSSLGHTNAVMVAPEIGDEPFTTVPETRVWEVSNCAPPAMTAPFAWLAIRTEPTRAPAAPAAPISLTLVRFRFTTNPPSFDKLRFRVGNRNVPSCRDDRARCQRFPTQVAEQVLALPELRGGGARRRCGGPCRPSARCRRARRFGRPR
jgi:hypothetical protein